MEEAELLFMQALGCDRISLYLNKDRKITRDKAGYISSVLTRRIKREPIAYILGKIEFMGLEFKVNEDVFIPRQETEILVEAACSVIARSGGLISKNTLRILDLGTGSGCIAVSLAKFLHDVRITAVDISLPALTIAKDNAILNNVADRIRFIEGNLFNNTGNYLAPHPCPLLEGERVKGEEIFFDSSDLQLMTYDLIVTNPPYIPSREIDGLQPEVKYEPRIALDGGEDGLDFYRRINKEAPAYLKENGLLIMEMGYNQRERIEDIFRSSKKFEIIDVVKDYSGIERVIVSKYKN